MIDIDRSTIRRLRHFWEKVNKTDTCWFWIGAKLGQEEYGLFWDGRKYAYAHRFSYELAHGPIPKGMAVCHSCDVNYPPGDKTYRRCIRPEHLFLGTSADNFTDMRQKQRHAHGTTHGHHKLNEETVRDIRKLWNEGYLSGPEIAERFNVTFQTISMVVHRKIWKHVE